MSDVEHLVYSIPDAAKLLGIDKRAMYRLVERGDFAYVSIGARKMIPRRVIEEKLAEATTHDVAAEGGQ